MALAPLTLKPTVQAARFQGQSQRQAVKNPQFSGVANAAKNTGGSNLLGSCGLLMGLPLLLLAIPAVLIGLPLILMAYVVSSFKGAGKDIAESLEAQAEALQSANGEDALKERVKIYKKAFNSPEFKSDLKEAYEHLYTHTSHRNTVQDAFKNKGKTLPKPATLISTLATRTVASLNKQIDSLKAKGDYTEAKERADIHLSNLLGVNGDDLATAATVHEFLENAKSYAAAKKRG